MFPLSHMMKSFVRVGTLKVIDAGGKVQVFSGEPGPNVTMRLSDRSLYHKLVFNPELNAGEAYMDGRLTFENSTLRDFLMLISINRVSLGSYPVQKVLRRLSRQFKRFQQANPIGQAQQNVAHHYDLGDDFYRLFWTRACSIPVPISLATTTPWSRRSATSCGSWQPSSTSRRV